MRPDDFTARIVRDTWVSLQIAFVSSAFCFWTGATPINHFTSEKGCCFCETTYGLRPCGFFGFGFTISQASEDLTFVAGGVVEDDAPPHHIQEI